jgi:hypothetical protein
MEPFILGKESFAMLDLYRRDYFILVPDSIKTDYITSLDPAPPC